MLLKIYLLCLGFAFCIASSCHDDFEHPCPSLDLPCIRKYLSKHSKCKPAYGCKDELDFAGDILVNIPHANVSFLWMNPVVSGLNCTKFHQFYINKKTNKLIIELLVDQGIVSSPKTTIKYFFKGKEPVALTDRFAFTFKQVSLTAIYSLNKNKEIDWKNRDFFAYFLSPDFHYDYGKCIYDKDARTRASFEKILNNLTLDAQEGSLVLSPSFFDFYINNNVCLIA